MWYSFIYESTNKKTKKWNNGNCALQRKTAITSVLVGVSVGCDHETDSENGIAHFLEHMCLKGTKKTQDPQKTPCIFG